ncbi:sulfurtransferase complex subunit TusB [Veronia pacifica]|uniref:Sulfur relay protein TusB n=1 Tax=Veronia pacifica TaxID=1080227 RepID=A0A1C3EAA8_9GAMM|nr:sulfurtransferase complex subunit TusB [Veronia pacifica]ODA30150.1 sulfur relay protein TusB [Veronia pacifica]
MLHTLHTSPFNHSGISLCLRYARPESEILLLEDGVIAGISGSLWQEKLKTSGMKVYALDVDLKARGLMGKVDKNIQIIDFEGFVSLTERHATQLKW